MGDVCVVDTNVLRKANAPLTVQSKEGRAFPKRLALLRRIQKGEQQILISARMMREYREQVTQPRNDLVRLFFELAADPRRHRYNWPAWQGSEKERQRRCRFPPEDTHVLRTAVVDGRSTIYTEEARMLRTDACIHREFQVHLIDPTL